MEAGESDAGSLLGPEDVEVLESLREGSAADCRAILEYVGSFISRGVSEGRFTEKEAHHDLAIALWVAYACNNTGDYEHFYTAAEWLSDVEDLAAGCGLWYYRYANAVMYCGRPAIALEYCERGVSEDPEYPWLWLTLGRLRAHFGDRRGAIDAARRGLELVPGDWEFMTLLDDIESGATIEQMESHLIDPEAEAEMLADPDGPETARRRLAASGIVCDREALDELKSELDVRGWSADHPYCTYLMDRGGALVMVTFMMSEAQLSKADRRRILRITGSVDALESQARAHLAERDRGAGMSLFGLSIGPDMGCKLSFSVNGSEDVLTVDFDPDLELVDDSAGGPFAAIVLLSDMEWDPQRVVDNMRDEWGVQISGVDTSDGALIGMVGDSILAVSLIPSRVPGTEAEDSAAKNFTWPEAVDAARSHKSHLVVAMVNHGCEPLDAGLLFVRLVESCCLAPNVLGVYHCGTVMRPSVFIDTAREMHAGEIPVADMVWFGMYRTSEGINAYTVGMNMYGRDEMEVLAARDSPVRVGAFLYDVAYHVLLNGTVFRDGDTLGFTEGQSLTVRRSPGVSVDGYSLKIEYPDP